MDSNVFELLNYFDVAKDRDIQVLVIQITGSCAHTAAVIQEGIFSQALQDYATLSPESKSWISSELASKLEHEHSRDSAQDSRFLRKTRCDTNHPLHLECYSWSSGLAELDSSGQISRDHVSLHLKHLKQRRQASSLLFVARLPKHSGWYTSLFIHGNGTTALSVETLLNNYTST